MKGTGKTQDVGRDILSLQNLYVIGFESDIIEQVFRKMKTAQERLESIPRIFIRLQKVHPVCLQEIGSNELDATASIVDDIRVSEVSHTPDSKRLLVADELLLDGFNHGFLAEN